jgi:glyoxylate/hydroxypyruvate reductase A
MTIPTLPLHVHFENDAGSPQVFKSTPQLLAEACARHPEVAAAITTSFGEDGHRLVEALRTANVVVGFNFPRHAFTGETAANLQLMQITGAGIEQLMPIDWLPEHVAVANASGAHAQKVGEYVTMALLMLNTRLPQFADDKPARRWTRTFTSSIVGKTALIIGVGGMGGAAAASAKRLGLRVLGVRPSGAPHESVDRMFTLDRLDEALALADFVVVAAPSTAASRGLLSREKLDLLPRGAGLVNVGRSPLVDYRALADKLKDGSLSGAVLDVFDQEPLSRDSFLWETPNLVMTPHISSDDAETYMAGVLDVVFANLRRLIVGEPPGNLVDRGKGY